MDYGFFSGGPITGVFWLPIMIFIFVISAIVTFIQWIIKKAKEAKRKEGKLIQSLSPIENSNIKETKKIDNFKKALMTIAMVTIIIIT